MSVIHALTITGCEGCTEAGEPECTCYPKQFDVQVTCPGVSDTCRAWDECVECNRGDDDVTEKLWETSEAHGVEHAHTAYGWCVRTEDCLVRTSDEIRDVVESAFPWREGVVPGAYQVRVVPGDDLELEFVTGVIL